jgi:hypothetical protein
MAPGEDIEDGPADIGPFRERGMSTQPSAGAGSLELAFFAHAGRSVHKWHHYLPLYDRYLAPLRERSARPGFAAQIGRYFGARAASPRPVRLLEIGVWQGGSLELWRGYFGPEAVIFGIDIDEACAALDGESGNHIRIGSQADAAFLRRVAVEMGGIDIVIDDGSHVAADQKASFDTLFPLVEDGGLYVVEDLHTAYWREFGGGYASGESFVARLKTLTDDMHHWYHRRGELITSATGHVAGLHIHDSIAFIEKRRVARPVTCIRGEANAG